LPTSSQLSAVTTNQPAVVEMTHDTQQLREDQADRQRRLVPYLKEQVLAAVWRISQGEYP
jgi:hypothetical protein